MALTKANTQSNTPVRTRTESLPFNMQYKDRQHLTSELAMMLVAAMLANVGGCRLTGKFCGWLTGMATVLLYELVLNRSDEIL